MNYKKYSRDIKLTKIIGDSKISPLTMNMKKFFDGIFNDLEIKQDDLTGKMTFYKLDYNGMKERIYVEYYTELKKAKYSMRFLNALPFVTEDIDDFMLNLLNDYLNYDIEEVELLTF